jgi:hypothetical protein
VLTVSTPAAASNIGAAIFEAMSMIARQPEFRFSTTGVVRRDVVNSMARSAASSGRSR